MARTARREDADITGGVIWKQLLLFFFPIVLGSFFQQMYNTADAIIVGKSVGKEALAAVGGATAVLLNLLIGFFTGLSSGATVIISQYYGARDHEHMSRALHTAAALALLFGVVLSAVGLGFSRQMLVWMDTPEAVLPHAVTYLRIIFFGMVPSLIYNIGSGILRAMGDSRRPMYFLITACMVNIVLDVILVLGAGLGVAGAAIATVLSQCVSAVLVIISLVRSENGCRLHPSRIRFDWQMLARILRIGLPAAVQSAMYSVSNVIIQRAVNGFDTDALAGWTAYGKIDFLFWMSINAFGIAITTFTGQNFGAGRIDRVKKSVRVCLVITMITTAVMSAVLLLGGRYMYMLFTDDPKVLEQAMSILNLLVPTYFTYVCIEILSGAVRGCGDSLIPTVMTLFGVCVLRLIWILGIVPKYNSLTMVLLSYPITWVFTSILFIVYYLRGGWLKRCLKQKEAA